MASDNWKDVLRAQQEDLARLEAMDAELSENQISNDIDKLLKRPIKTDLRLSSRGSDMAPNPPSRKQSAQNPAPRPALDDSMTDEPPPKSPTMEVVDNLKDGGQAPETADRILRAKYAFMTKQLAAAADLRKKMEEQSRDIQRQLQTEREEKKALQKRMSLMEAELRKNARRAPGPQEAPAPTEDLTQEVVELRKNLEAAQRLVKQAETNAKTKDAQLKRAAETIARLKQQVQETTDSATSGTDADRARAVAAENRVKVLEKQRADLMEGFRKQLKLIDILKRQKVHLEAARLLAFTEDEFMKTLDWKV